MLPPISMSQRYVVVMAGGSGTRFWPKSRAHHPKQFLSIGSERSLLRETIDRVTQDVGVENVYVVTGAAHAQHATASLPELPRENVLIEPEGRNTAPCIGWATRTILARDPAARVAVLPADHYIGDVPAFRAHLDAAFEAASERIVLFGIVPSYPETGYGYILRGDVLSGNLHKVGRFVEKPDRPTAERYLAERTYLWNSGMFVFPAAVMAAEIERLMPELHRGLLNLGQNNRAIGTVYPTLPSISIDYGVMEKSERIAVMPAQFGWSDVGSWDAAMEIGRPDADGNVLEGDAIAVGAKRSMADARAGRFVALVGVEDLIVVDTEDAVLVIKRGEAQKVKNVVDLLKAKSRKELL
jgi:mannose-1-phosphate guanylyltransferase